MRLTVKHHFDFGDDRALVGDDLVRPEAWDALRTRTTGAFAAAESPEGLDAQADARPEIGERARQIDALLRERDVRRLASYGAGAGIVERWLHRHNPELGIVATDYGEATLERLRRIFPELDLVHHDLLSDAPLDADLHLFHRIDTEFSNRQLRQVLRRFAAVPILLVATDVNSLRTLIDEVRKGRRPGTSKAGYARNRAAFEALCGHAHDARPMRLHDLEAWMLEPRRP